MKEALEIRKAMKAKKPSFTRQDNHKKPSLGRSGWRRPRGWQSKIRLQKKGYKRIVKPGYRSPVEVRGKNKEGKEIVQVSNAKDILNMNKNQIAVVTGSVGFKKRAEIVDAAKKQGIMIMNVDATKFAEAVKNRQADASAKKKLLAERRKKKAVADEKKKKEESVKETTPEDEEAKKKEEKQEKDKLLTKKGAEF